jgi:hypothetical protein
MDRPRVDIQTKSGFLRIFLFEFEVLCRFIKNLSDPLRGQFLSLFVHMHKQTSFTTGSSQKIAGTRQLLCLGDVGRYQKG